MAVTKHVVRSITIAIPRSASERVMEHGYALLAAGKGDYLLLKWSSLTAEKQRQLKQLLTS